MLKYLLIQNLLNIFDFYKYFPQSLKYHAKTQSKTSEMLIYSKFAS